VALAIALGLAVGAAAWTVAGTQSVSVANRSAYVAAIHEKIEAHQATVAAGVDRRYDAIEWQRTHAANAAAMGDLPFAKSVENLSIRRGYDQMPLAADHRLDAIETAGGLPAGGTTSTLPRRDNLIRMPDGDWVASGSVPAAGSVVAGADPVDTPWGPRPAPAGSVVQDTRGGVPSQAASVSNWVRTPWGNQPLP
jgi:hypothetical protein